jgi:hypothetical protein
MNFFVQFLSYIKILTLILGHRLMTRTMVGMQNFEPLPMRYSPEKIRVACVKWNPPVVEFSCSAIPEALDAMT